LTTELVSPGIYAERHTLYYWDTGALGYVVATVPVGGVGGGGDASAANQTTEIAKLTSIDGKTPALGQALAASSLPVVLTASQLTTLTPFSSVSVSNFPATQAVSIATMPSTPVTGTFWQATQPVSGTVSVGNFPATQPVSIASMPSTPVTGTFWQATQPVSLATNTPDVTDRAGRLVGVVSNANIDVALSTRLKPADTLAAVTTVGTITNAVTVSQATAASLNATVTQQAITKATQGTTGVTTQDLKDAGRSARTITLDSFAVAATAETLMTMSYSTDNGTLTTGTSYTVTSGKRLRINSINCFLHTITGNTTAVNVIVRLRVNNGGAALVSSPVQMIVPIQGIAAVNQAGLPVDMSIPDGWEFVAGAGIGVTVACAGFVTTTAAPKVSITLTGYEY
jgi:hypothetical protein